jgi:hypothetical protein
MDLRNSDRSRGQEILHRRSLAEGSRGSIAAHSPPAVTSGVTAGRVVGGGARKISCARIGEGCDPGLEFQVLDAPGPVGGGEAGSEAEGGGQQEEVFEGRFHGGG